MSHTEELRKIVMEEIFDQRKALQMLAHLDSIKTEIELSKVRVTDREDRLQDSLVKLGNEYEQALDLLLEMSKAIHESNPDHPMISKYLQWMHK
ncbi:MAG: hypothetical protein Tp1111DCM1126091_140 [Prokaryotic dsDNA virus sp.]|nr:MAG: hypothetical protein Tp1111DCM1126091_140 [Prokaryotic dsDNA virus sp.]|tara:strand:- start:13860 stop:14141 length:282 start_codon:yes stop_codon:yes gene_type:complete